jgi:hypothetical protein
MTTGAAAIERYLGKGFEPVSAGGIDAALRIEALGALAGRVVDASQARAAVAAAA